MAWVLVPLDVVVLVPLHVADEVAVAATFQLPSDFSTDVLFNFLVYCDGGAVMVVQWCSFVRVLVHWVLSNDWYSVPDAVVVCSGRSEVALRSPSRYPGWWW